MSAPAQMEVAPGIHAEITRADTWPAFSGHLPTCDLAVIDCRDSLLFRACAHFLTRPWARTPIVAVDLVLRKPEGVRQRLGALAKRALFSRIDHFIHYFRDVSGYDRYFGIPWQCSSYVPFKVNNLDSAIAPDELTEEYIIAVGRSLRDYDTFIRAVERLPYPAVISEFCFESFEGKAASFRWTPENVPGNLSIVKDSGNRADFIRNLARARVVVIPTLGSSLCASGISSYLDAMYLGKCVVISHGPGASDLLTDQALLVPPHDVGALSSAIQRVWENDELRKRIGASGSRYAASLGGEQELLQRIFCRSVDAVLGTAVAVR